MSSSVKAVIVIVVVAVAAGIIWWAISAPSVNSNQAGNTNATGTISQGSSDQDLNQDLTSIDAQINGLASDSASVNQSMNDQPISQ